MKCAELNALTRSGRTNECSIRKWLKGVQCGASLCDQHHVTLVLAHFNHF